MCTQCAPSIDTRKADQFAAKMLGHINGAAVSLMSSIGHRTGLFDTMAKLPPSSSHDIAGAAGLNERYVREWLGTMVTAGVVEYEPADRTYHLPAEHAAWLTRAASPNNIATTTQWISVLGHVESKIVDCFRNGGGLAYGDYDRFHEVMAEESSQTVVVPLLDQLLPAAPGLKERLEAGIDVLDVGCGSGKALIHLAREFPKSRFTGYDLCEEAVARATMLARSEGVTNVTFECKDVTDFGHGEKFDLIFTFDAVHDQAKPAAVLRNIHQALRPGGVYFMQEIAGETPLEENRDHLVAPFLYTISCMHCMSVSLGQDGAGLGAMWGRALALQMLREAGFEGTEVKQLEHDIINYYYISRK